MVARDFSSWDFLYCTSIASGGRTNAAGMNADLGPSLPHASPLRRDSSFIIPHSSFLPLT
jgi:hypothetical protein